MGGGEESSTQILLKGLFSIFDLEINRGLFFKKSRQLFREVVETSKIKSLKSKRPNKFGKS